MSLKKLKLKTGLIVLYEVKKKRLFSFSQCPYILVRSICVLVNLAHTIAEVGRSESSRSHVSICAFLAAQGS